MNNYKVIDCKMKEIYFNTVLLDDQESEEQSRALFWKSLNNIAMQNMSVIQMKCVH